ncbi:dATP/dGTP pyrophosphohydrolase domain-containing protein [Enterobacter sp. RHBSTW-00593]|uniref:dATP/dGTP pyrophosphohydrolase domain-containing protein n=1 Tax=Enterobacter sp. RHBSTW-00593 TaxID=2742656 RepID=UPI0020176E55|nr:dATP/dGTP pyrophosphohydrolase domain-containing protein [Enterobacter sp. RHBSTW-00593]
MSTITKERVAEFIKNPLDNGLTRGEQMELARIALASLEAEAVPEWTNEQCMEFLSIAFRHAEINGDLQLDDIRLGVKMVNGSRAAMLQGADGNSPVITDEKGSSLQLRNLIRQRHAEWSQATFGDVGPVGPLKHLSKEALEAAAEPEDLSEWADMQFLLWDAQRRAGISDVEITAAMEEKLKVNMARQWPEPKDGEPRQHIKAAPQQEVK